MKQPMRLKSGGFISSGTDAGDLKILRTAKNIGKVLGTGLIPGLAKKGDLQKFATSGLGGIIPMAVARQQKKSKAKKARMASANMPPASGGPSAGMGMTEMTRRMAMGGEIKRTKPIDGIAMKGKTRAI